MELTHIWPGWHLWSQLPQCAGLLVRLVQLVDWPQAPLPLVHRHWLVWQVVPPVHVLPQTPQLDPSELVSTHAPAHSVSPGGQLVVHAPPAQTRPVPHAAPQEPQLAGSLAVSVQTPPQSVAPPVHAQTPALHSCPPVQAAPQEPQWAGSVSVDTHAPPQRVCPAEHAGGAHMPLTHASPAAQA